MIQLPYFALCRYNSHTSHFVVKEGRAWNEPKQKNCIVLHIAQNEPRKLPYVGEWNSVVREALHSFEGKLFALEPLVAHCVQETKGVDAHTMATKVK